MRSGEPAALVLVGPMGAGKSSIGRRVARGLNLPFTDTDRSIVRTHGPIPRIFEEHGEAHFRALEHDAVLAALGAGGVVALGGGAVLHEGTRRALVPHRVALLTVDPRVVAGRIQGTDRPLLAGDEAPLARWERILAERLPLYEQVADETFDTSRGPMSSVVDDIVAWAQEEL